MTQPIPEWFQTATLHRDTDGIGGKVEIREDFANLFHEIQAELKRAGKAVARRKDLEKVQVVVYYKTDVRNKQTSNILDSFVPVFDEVELLAIPGTALAVDRKGRLLGDSRHTDGYARYDLIDIQTKAELEAILNGLQQL